MAFLRWRLRSLRRMQRVAPSDESESRLPCAKTLATLFDDGKKRRAYNSDILMQTTHLPRSIFCPITNMPMVDPMIAPDGDSYEREDIVRWLMRRRVSPVTNEPIAYPILIPNHALRNVISELIE